MDKQKLYKNYFRYPQIKEHIKRTIHLNAKESYQIYIDEEIFETIADKTPVTQSQFANIFRNARRRFTYLYDVGCINCGKKMYLKTGPSLATWKKSSRLCLNCQGNANNLVKEIKNRLDLLEEMLAKPLI